MNIEKLIFKKIELWVVLLIIVLGAIFTAAIIAGSYYVGKEGKRLGKIGDVFEFIAKVQIDTAAEVIHLNDPLISKDDEVDITAQKTEEGDLSIQQGYFRWPNHYTEIKNVPGNWSSKPLIWKSNNADFSSPIVIQAKLNDSGEEALLLFNRQREFIDLIPIRSQSYSGLYEAYIGSQPYIMEDGTDLIIYPIGGDGLYRTDTCGKIIWSRPGLYHHHFSIADGVLGILGLPKKEITDNDREKWNHSDVINLIDIANGKLLKSFSLRDIVSANTGLIDPFLHEEWRDIVNPDGVLEEDKVHLNKVEILSKKLANDYPLFPAGSILLSSRSLNLLTIIDPDTLKILWYSSGHTQVQHDPFFIGNNRILVFNNSYDKNVDTIDHPSNFSSLRLYDFGTNTWSEPVNAYQECGYTFHSGSLDHSEKGHTVMTLTLQGRYIEYNENGQAIFEFVNLRDNKSAYWTKNAQYITNEQASQILDRTCR